MTELWKGLEPLRSVWLWATPVAASVFLIVVVQHSPLAFHTLAELFSVVLMFTMFAFVWFTRVFSPNNFLMFLGCGLVWIGGLDLIHTLVYKGMNVFTEGNGNLAVQFWVSARGSEALLLFLAPFAAARQLNAHLLMSVFGAIAAFLTALIYSENFPVGFVEGKGLTDFKIYSEYLINVVLVMALINLLYHRHRIVNVEVSLISTAILFIICSELLFTFYVDVFGLSNIAGHILKLFSSWLIFLSVISSNLRRPYRALSESEKRFRSLFENSEISIWNEDLSAVREGLDELRENGVTDLRIYLNYHPEVVSRLASQVIVKRVNAATLKLFEVEDKYPLLTDIRKIFGPGAMSIFLEELVAIWDGQPSFRSEIELRSARGAKIQAIVTFQIPEREESFSSIPISVVDITERKQLDAELYQAGKLATLGEMSTGIAHELNQPLNIISMAAQSAEEHLSDGELDPVYLKKKFERIRKQVERAVGITNHMRIFGRNSPTSPELFDPCDVVDSALDLMGQQLKVHNIEITRECPSDHQANVLGFRSLLEQVLLNLLTNARDAIEAHRSSPEIKGHIHFRCKKIHENLVEISIEDDGGGVPEKLKEKIFDPFFTTKEVGKGTGLGLSISYGIIKDMQGSIRVISVEEGASFVIQIPRRPAGSPELNKASGYDEGRH